MRSVPQYWYQKDWRSVLLWPVSLIFQVVAMARRLLLTRLSRNLARPAPVVIVGNISVGGTGKTPLLILLARELHSAGLRPGIISRGYGGAAAQYPCLVKDQSDAQEVGDEAIMLARRTGLPVVVDPDRYRAYRYLCETHDCDVVLSDDGLQHYRLPRDIEIVVVDGQRQFGNGWCLPAGPLREPVSRLRSVRHVVLNSAGPDSDKDARLQGAVTMTVQPRYLVNLASGDKKPFNGAPFKLGTTIHAVSGIGNPERFIELLKKLPYGLKRHDFPDHHPYREEDLSGIDGHQPIVMTEKDAVKCRKFAAANYWYLSTETQVPEEFTRQLVNEVSDLAGKYAKRNPGEKRR